MPDQAAFLGLLFHQEQTTMGYGCGASRLRWDGKQLVGDPLLTSPPEASGFSAMTREDLARICKNLQKAVRHAQQSEQLVGWSAPREPRPQRRCFCTTSRFRAYPPLA
jgi:hypothetical protein